MANLPVASFPRTGPALATDILGGSRSPFAAGDDLRLTLAQILTFIANNQTTMLNLSGSAFTIVGGSSNTTTNGTNLVAAYAAAKLATPHGAALSKNNRFTIFLLPGVYTLTGDALVLDTQFIDLVGLSENTGSTVWTTGTFSALEAGDIQLQSTGNTLSITAGSTCDVTIRNLALLTSAAGTKAFNPNNVGVQFKMINVFVQNTSAQTNAAMAADVSFTGYYEDVRCWNTSSFAFRLAASANADGVFIRCKAADSAFGGSISNGTNGQATGVFIDCEADGGSFGRNAASGTFLRCRFVNIVGETSGMFGWGSGATATGTFVLCSGNSFPCFGESASGTFRYCTSTNAAFGFGGTANGLFEYCSCAGAAGVNSFGGPTSSGTFRYCEVTNGIGFAASATASGTYEWCRTSSFGFGGWSTTGGTFSGTARNCSAGAQAFGFGATGAGTMSGKLENCAMTGHGLVALTGKITNMRIEAVAANTTALQLDSSSTGALYDCTIIGTGSGLSIDVISGTPTIVVAHCRLNKGIGASVTNSVTTPYNVDQSVIV